MLAELCRCTEGRREQASGEEKVFGRFWRGWIWMRGSGSFALRLGDIRVSKMGSKVPGRDN